MRTSAVQGLATFLMVLVACSLDHQGHSPAGLLMGLTVATVTITMGQNAGASMNPAADVMPRCRHCRTTSISHLIQYLCVTDSWLRCTDSHGHPSTLETTSG